MVKFDREHSLAVISSSEKLLLRSFRLRREFLTCVEDTQLAIAESKLILARIETTLHALRGIAPCVAASRLSSQQRGAVQKALP